MPSWRTLPSTTRTWSCYVLKPGRSYELLQENQMEGRILATPAAVGHAMFLRTDGALYRIEKPATQASR